MSRYTAAEVAARHADLGLLVVDWERILFVNPALTDLLGVPEVELVGHPLRRFTDFLGDGDAGDRLHNAFRQGQPFRGEVICRPTDREPIPLELQATPVAAESTSTGSPLEITRQWMVVISARDLRHSKRLEHQLWQSQRLDAITNLADGVANEMNNVIQVLTGYGSLLTESLSKDDPRATDLKSIELAARRGGALLKELLAFARRRPVTRGPMDLTDVVRGWQDLIQTLVGAEIRLMVDLADGLPPVHADRGEAQQILLNLVSNAREAMGDGGTLTITTHYMTPTSPIATVAVDDRVSAYVVLTVEDTGIGMSPDTKSHLFQPFFTTKDERGGRGLGLATVHEIVREAGGLVWVRSRPGEGTSVEVHFPALDVALDQPEQTPASGAPLPRGSETVLVVDDDALVLRVASRALERLGYRVFSAAGAAQATAIAAERGNELDVLLTDVMMPGQRGTGLAEELQADWPQLKVVFMTGYPLDPESLGANVGRLSKPFSLEELAVVVRAELDR